MRLSVTELCDLRCRYCMPEEGICKKPHEAMLSEEEMLRAVAAAASLGIHKLRITGGEPLVKKNILSLCERASQIPGIEELCMTTNGTLLAPVAKDLKAAGVRRINISIDSLKPEKYNYITRLGRLEDALKGIDAALDAAFDKLKLNVVLIGGFNDDEIEDFVKLSIDRPLNVRFIELMPMAAGSAFGPEAYIKNDVVLEKCPDLRLQEKQPRDGVARSYKLPGAMGGIGLISPISSHFCSSCNRLRLTADGKIKPCLHSSAEYDIKGLSLEEMTEVFRRAVDEKPEWHGLLDRDNPSGAARDMNQIGG